VDEDDSRVFCSNWNMLMKNLWKKMREIVNHSFIGERISPNGEKP
jgi:hypothetical protein